MCCGTFHSSSGLYTLNARSDFPLCSCDSQECLQTLPRARRVRVGWEGWGWGGEVWGPHSQRRTMARLLREMCYSLQHIAEDTEAGEAP